VYVARCPHGTKVAGTIAPRTDQEMPDAVRALLRFAEWAKDELEAGHTLCLNRGPWRIQVCEQCEFENGPLAEAGEATAP